MQRNLNKVPDILSWQHLSKKPTETRVAGITSIKRWFDRHITRHDVKTHIRDDPWLRSLPREWHQPQAPLTHLSPRLVNYQEPHASSTRSLIARSCHQVPQKDFYRVTDDRSCRNLNGLTIIKGASLPTAMTTGRRACSEGSILPSQGSVAGMGTSRSLSTISSPLKFVVLVKFSPSCRRCSLSTSGSISFSVEVHPSKLGEHSLSSLSDRYPLFCLCT